MAPGRVAAPRWRYPPTEVSELSLSTWQPGDVKRVAGVVACVVLAAVSPSCGDESGRSSSSVDSAVLPFGLEIVAGTELIGRPAVYDEPAFFYNGEPVPARKLQAAFWVTADDPVAVMRAWVGQLDRLALDQVTVQRGYDAPAQWMKVTGMTTFVPDHPSGDWADLQLWATSRHPVLLVSINKIRGEAHAPAVNDDAGDPPEPSVEIEELERHDGDPLFTEQGDTVHVPDGSEALMPTLPTFGGTGGSTSVLAATDADDAVGALLDEAQALSEFGEVTGPTQSEVDGVRVVIGSFVIPAGGWGFTVVAVRAPSDSAATVYVTSSAD